MSKVITLLGSTGSIGTQSLDVCRMHGYEVFGLSANSSVDKLLAQIAEFHPKYVAVTDPAAFDKLSAALAGQADAPKLLKGAEGLRALACMDGAGTVLNAVVGIAGLDASLAAIESGHDLALANKESLVTGGHLVTDAVKKHGVHLLPVDSEHSAIFQCLQDQHSAKTLEKILLTASGGPFFGMTTEQLRTKTKADALKHPNWNMGAKITIDSATLMNKGLELIEAAWLFGLPEDKIQIVVQRESIIHSAVQFADHSIIAQLGVPDMRIPIQPRAGAGLHRADQAEHCNGGRRDLPLPQSLQKGYPQGRSGPLCRQRCERGRRCALPARRDRLPGHWPPGRWHRRQ